MNKYLEKIAEDLPIAVIIKGNPKYIQDPKMKSTASNFYKDLENKLKEKGYKTERATSKAYSLPNIKAKVWIGHSRGIDRLRFAKGQITIALQNKSQEGLNPKHYELSNQDIEAINRL